MGIPVVTSLHLADNLASLAQTLDHLQTLLPPPDGVVALFEEVVNLIGAVHVLQELTLHLVFGVRNEVQHDSFWNHVNHGAAGDVVVRVDE